MRLTTKGRYAVTAMLDLALHSSDQPVSLADISGRQDISLSYLEQLFSKLRRNSLVSSVRGPGGGYRLSRGGHDIFVAQIIDAVNDTVDATVGGIVLNADATGGGAGLLTIAVNANFSADDAVTLTGENGIKTAVS